MNSDDHIVRQMDKTRTVAGGKQIYNRIYYLITYRITSFIAEICRPKAVLYSKSLFNAYPIMSDIPKFSK